MPSLKDLKNRITSVKSTRKITSAMKMVAASKLRRAQDQAESARPYAERMARMLSTLVVQGDMAQADLPLLKGTGKEESILLLVLTSDRGLCGAFNSSIIREARRLIREYEGEGKTVKLICIGRKGRDLLRREHGSKIVMTIDDIGKKNAGFGTADKLTKKILEMFEAGEFDVARVVYNRFKSAISQIVTLKQIVPVHIEPVAEETPEEPGTAPALYEMFEPSKDAILAQLLPRNLAVQVYSAILESTASEYGARMTAMDNATRNAGEMIDRLTLNYNRSRQAFITKELIEIISGAEAV